MAKNNNLKEFLAGIANTIREENGSTELINPQDFESKITEIADRFKNFIQGTLTEITPEMLTGVTKIREYTFYDYSSIKSIIIPIGITSIGKWAFNNCSSIQSVNIPSTVTSIGENAFNGCTSLTSVHITDLIAWLEISFGGASANPLNTSHHLYLNDEEIKDLVIPNKITSVKRYAFFNCIGLTSVTIGNSVTSIDDGAFNGCSNLNHVIIGDNVTAVGSRTFNNCKSLTSLIIPNTVVSIGTYAFYGCTGLTSVKYNGNVILANYLFSNCSKVSKYDFRNAKSIPTLGNKSYLGHATGCKIIVPDTLYDSWKAATNWSALTDVTWVKVSEYTEE